LFPDVSDALLCSLLNKKLFAADHLPLLRFYFTLQEDAGQRAQAAPFYDGNYFLKNNPYYW
jgi:hypothetical protein